MGSEAIAEMERDKVVKGLVLVSAWGNGIGRVVRFQDIVKDPSGFVENRHVSHVNRQTLP